MTVTLSFHRLYPTQKRQSGVARGECRTQIPFHPIKNSKAYTKHQCCWRRGQECLCKGLCCAHRHVQQHSCYKRIPFRLFHSSVLSLLLSYVCVVLSHQVTPPWFSFHSRNHYYLFVCSAYKTPHVFFTYVISKHTCFGQAITEGSSLIGETSVRLCVVDACWARPPATGLWGLYGHMKYRSHLMLLWIIL